MCAFGQLVFTPSKTHIMRRRTVIVSVADVHPSLYKVQTLLAGLRAHNWWLKERNGKLEAELKSLKRELALLCKAPKKKSVTPAKSILLFANN
jgi:hypothetical protein